VTVSFFKKDSATWSWVVEMSYIRSSLFVRRKLWHLSAICSCEHVPTLSSVCIYLLAVIMTLENVL